MTGRYFEDHNEALSNTGEEFSGVAAYGLDPESATRLWEISLELLAR